MADFSVGPVDVVFEYALMAGDRCFTTPWRLPWLQSLVLKFVVHVFVCFCFDGIWWQQSPCHLDGRWAKNDAKVPKVMGDYRNSLYNQGFLNWVGQSVFGLSIGQANWGPGQ
jgi:hypothetical protein